MKSLRLYFVPGALALLMVAAAGAGCYLAVLEIGRGVANEARGTLTDTREVLRETAALVKDAHDSIDDNYPDLKATIETVATTAKDADDLTHDLRAALTGGVDTQGKTREGLLETARLMLGDSRELIQGLRADVDRVTDSTDAALAPLGTTLQHVSDLAATLDKQLQTGSPQVFATVDALHKALEDLDQVIADPHVAQLLASGADTAGHLAESAESIAMRPWRQKAKLVKVIIEKALGLVKFTFPL